MTRITPPLGVAGVIVVIGCLSISAFAQQQPTPTTPREKGSYALGVNVMSNLRQQGVDVDFDLVVRGMKDALTAGPYLLSEEEIRIAVKNYQTMVRRQQSAASAKALGENRKEAEEFFARNKSAAGVVMLPSGLQYKILKAGSGKMPTDADIVTVNFRGTLLNGTEVERSPADKSATLKVGNTLGAWREALKLMPEGSTWQLFVPAQLAYGDRGRPGARIGPGAALIYELELLSVRQAEKGT